MLHSPPFQATCKHSPHNSPVHELLDLRDGLVLGELLHHADGSVQLHANLSVVPLAEVPPVRNQNRDTTAERMRLGNEFGERALQCH